MKKSMSIIAMLSCFAMVTISCQNQPSDQNKSDYSAQQAGIDDANSALLYSDDCITEREVVEAQKMWGQGIVRIGKVFQ
jgi:hypothetical protein